MEEKVTVLDCTFRDGGYYNKWDFNIGVVQRYLSSIESAKIPYVELGFRSFPQDKFLGAFAYTTDDYIRSLCIPKDVTVGVMVDAKTILHSGFEVEEAVGRLFVKAESSPVDLVRIAAHFSEVAESKLLASTLSNLGYKVGFNLMQSGGQSEEALMKSAQLVDSWGAVDVLYFADSLGNMDSNEVKRIISALKRGWAGELGIHTHNNKGKALENTLAAIGAGVRWVDSTMLGMGRGAGNAQTETLLLELNREFQQSYQAESLFEIVLNDFVPLQDKYGWGSNLLYHLAANYDIHPTYIQEMLTDKRYSTSEILQTIQFMEPLLTKSFNKTLLDEARNGSNCDSDGSWVGSDWCKGREVLILGAGPSLIEHEGAIIQYIKKYSPLVMSLNVAHAFTSELIDIYVASNTSRFLIEGSRYSNLEKPMVLPVGNVKSALGNFEFSSSILDYGLNISSGSFVCEPTNCTLPSSLAIGYALAIATTGSASKISLVGFDGYPVDDPKQIEMESLLSLYSAIEGALPVVALTPTNYSITKSSIYAPQHND